MAASSAKIWIAVLLATTSTLAYDLHPDDVAVVGALDYGQTSDPIEYSGTPRFSALVFNGSSNDRIEVTLRGGDDKGELKIANGGLKELAAGTGHISFTLPDTGPDPEAYYIVFRDAAGKAVKFTVQLTKATPK